MYTGIKYGYVACRNKKSSSLEKGYKKEGTRFVWFDWK